MYHVYQSRAFIAAHAQCQLLPLLKKNPSWLVLYPKVELLAQTS